MRLRLLFCLFVLLACASASAEKTAPVIREEQTVFVDGVRERWRLQWESPTTPACSPDEPDNWPTCPCVGLAFGECGELALVRKRPGHADERLALSDVAGCLQRWEVQPYDLRERDSPGFAARVKARPVVRIMHFADYDHDGRATEFVLEIGDPHCRRMCVLIGISRKNPRLHVFTTAEHPNEPLVLRAHQWEALAEAEGPVKVVDLACLDHGSQIETELELRTDEDGIHATISMYECTESGKRGRFLRKCILGPAPARDCEEEEGAQPDRKEDTSSAR